ncbi:MAG: aminotransferase class V-fold PLP-dependent enzyme [Planctomycetes bacterium]|nr:aminotransferase class V-fold PLP-dependent enzyme [Planctomycetota bacterium]
MTLDPSPEEMRRIGQRAVDRIVADRAALRDARVFTEPDAAALRELLAEPLPRQGLGLDATLDRFFDVVLPSATRVDHPRFLAYVPAPGSYAGALGAWLAAATNLFVGTWLGGASAAQLEVQVLDWLREALGLDSSWSTGVLTSGGSLANLQALAAARDRCAGPLARKTLYASAEAHDSVRKAAHVLGFEPQQLRTVPVGLAQELRVDALAERIMEDRARGLRPCAVVATVGTTSTGAIDDVAACRALCDRHGMWLHADGAWGAALALCEERGDVRAAIAAADSLTIDAHKWLYAPIDCGCLLTRRSGALERTFGGRGAYLQDVPEDAVNFHALGPELTRGSRALKLWMLLRGMGIDAIAAAIRGDCARARRARDRLVEDPRITIVTEPRLAVFSFRVSVGDDDDGTATRQTLARLHAGGHTFLSSSRVNGGFVIRFCVTNHRTTDDDVDAAVDAILAAI